MLRACGLGVQVSAPQLTLLETVMARMERVDVWILMNGGGGGVNPCIAISVVRTGMWMQTPGLALRRALLLQVYDRGSEEVHAGQ